MVVPAIRHRYGEIEGRWWLIPILFFLLVFGIIGFTYINLRHSDFHIDAPLPYQDFKMYMRRLVHTQNMTFFRPDYFCSYMPGEKYWKSLRDDHYPEGFISLVKDMMARNNYTL